MITAAVLPAPHQPMELRRFPKPTLEPGAVLLRTLGSEVCGTDTHLAEGQLAGVPYPIIPGHVTVGVIEEIGPVTNGTGVLDPDGKALRLGQIVTFLDVYGNCGRCWFCTVGKATTRCPDRKVYGVTLSADEGLLGGWAEYVYLRPGVHIVPLPDELDWRAFLSAGCGMPTALHAISLGDVQFGDTVLVQGAGPVGLSAAVLAQLRGAGQVIVVGGPPVRLEAASKFGVDTVIDIAQTTETERHDLVQQLTNGRGADVTIEATGVPAAVPEGMRLTRDAGTYVVVGQYTNVGDATFNPHLDLNQKHLTIRGCWGSDVGHVYRSVLVMARYSGQFPWTELISADYDLAHAQDALNDVAAQRVVKALIVP